MNQPMAPAQLPRWVRRPWAWLALGLVIIYVRGLCIDVMDVDASQYASISMEMLQHGHWLQLQHHSADYLDKPPLLFWTSALSFAVFGLHNWSYKLPSLLAAIAAVYAVYRFSLLFYARATARNAAFILASCIGLILICNDVRTDTLLLGMTTGAMWQLAAYLQPARHADGDPGATANDRAGGRARTGHLVLAAVFIGLAMVAKGPIGLVAPGFAVGVHLALHRDWRRLFQWQWLLGGAVVAVVLLPMCWGLYQQFDLQPNTLINGQTGVSGLKFFFWDQSFGRITGASPFRNGASPFYFLHVYLWAFLPWSLLLIGALWQRISAVVRQRFRLPRGDEAYSLGGFVLTFIALSLSRYKLPHYIFLTLPWAAILTARWLATPAALGRAWWRGQYVVFVGLSLVLLWLLRGVFPTGNVLLWAVVLAIFGSLLVICWHQPFPPATERLVQRSVLAAVGTAFVLNFHFYPNLLPYQSTAVVPRFARTAHIASNRLASYNREGDAMDFYAGQVVPVIPTAAAVRQRAVASGDYWLYTDVPGRARLDSAGVAYTETGAFQHFEVALLTGTFLNASTRSKALQPVYLLRILSQQPSAGSRPR
jgi:4-amino-4-deoxy-L-arabinose transferase-like glycosyltransferase